jgi:hypothetical protein
VESIAALSDECFNDDHYINYYKISFVLFYINAYISGRPDPCAKRPCLNGGRCCKRGYSYKCTCRSGYSGNNCQVVQRKYI